MPGIGARTLRKILRWANGDAERLEFLFRLDDAELRRTFGLKPETIARLHEASLDSVQQLADQLAANGFDLISDSDLRYPERLQRLGDSAPLLLYLCGDPGLLTKAGIAFSGARNASANGIQHTTNLAQAAVERGLTVISGAASGVDEAAHRSALEHGGDTVLVLPEGALRFKPRAELRTLIESASGRSAIISEFSPLATWSVANAMIRNGTIVALAQRLIIIEAGDSGGTLDAGRRGLALGIPTYALQYADPRPTAIGNALLIKEGALPIATEPAPVLSIWDIPAASKSTPVTSEPEQFTLF